MFTSIARTMVRSSLNLSVRPAVLPGFSHVIPNLAARGVTGRMFAVQSQLPHLPVPPLEQTLEKYLRSVKPLVSEEEYEYTVKMVEKFKTAEGPGNQLQQFLEDRATKTTNWLADWWLHVAYLDFRLPVVVHSSPGIVLPVQDFTDQEGQLRFAAKLISGILEFKKMVDNQSFPVEQLGGRPLCMTQYYKILSACRIPGRKHDSVVVYPSNEPNPPKHIVVIHNNHFFKLDVYSESGKRFTDKQLLKQLYRIVEKSAKRAPPVGILTTEGRNTWGKVYEKLMKDARNKESIDDIQRSIFILCIDSPLQHTSPEERFALVSQQVLHGLGSQWNSGNRWFDKTLQFIVGNDGACGLNYEHSMAEGPPIASLIDHAVSYCNKPTPDRTAPAKTTEVKELKFVLNDSLKADIQEACERIDELVADVQSSAFKFEAFGKNFPKSQKISPDSFIQVALQLAYYSIYKEPGATYESGSTRMFKLGRTDTIRSCTIETTEFSQAMQDSNISNNVKVDLLRKAISSHREYIDSAVRGEAVDRHLLGLKLAAIEKGMNVPDIFMDTTYSTSVTHKLSTSQVAAKSEAVLTFGPTAANGYGICYNPQPDQIIFAVTAFNSSPETDTNKMEASIHKSLTDMHDLLLVTGKAKL